MVVVVRTTSTFAIPGTAVTLSLAKWKMQHLSFQDEIREFEGFCDIIKPAVSSEWTKNCNKFVVK